MSEEKKQNGVKLKIVGVRMSFPHLFERDNYKRYSANFLVVPGSEQDKAIKAAINQAAINMWGDKAVERLKQFVAKDEVCYRDGNAKLDSNGDPTPGYENMMYLTGTSQVQPTLLNETRDEIGKDSGKLYSGSFVTAIVEIWPQNDTRKNYYGIRCQIQGVQHYKDGESFGGGRKANRDEFDDAPVNPDAPSGGAVGGNPDDNPFA